MVGQILETALDLIFQANSRCLRGNRFVAYGALGPYKIDEQERAVVLRLVSF